MVTLVGDRHLEIPHLMQSLLAVAHSRFQQQPETGSSSAPSAARSRDRTLERLLSRFPRRVVSAVRKQRSPAVRCYTFRVSEAKPSGTKDGAAPRIETPGGKMPFEVERSALDSGVTVLALSGSMTMGNQLQQLEW